VSPADDPASHLAAVLRVEGDPHRADTFIGQCPAQSFDRVYGGQLAAQSLLASAATVERQLRPISAHISFLKIGAISRPVRYTVERAHEGRSLATRVVHAYQGERLLSVSIVSFQHVDTEHGELDHDPPLTPAADPDSLPTRDASMTDHYGTDITSTMAMSSWPVEVRYVDRAPWSPGPSEPRNRLWLRSTVALDDDPLSHCAALLYAADLHLPEPILFPNRLSWYDLVNARGVFGASLDYTLYFHRDFRFDEWLLHEQEAQAIANSRGLTTGRFWTRDGVLAASAVELVGIFMAEAR
jgi:acyl-CoA thioesterase II